MNTTATTRPQRYSTAELAQLLRVRPQTIRRALCVTGGYLGIRYTKLANGRLLWDGDDAERIASGEREAA